MRVLLIVFLIHGLVPGIGELVETVVHRVSTGHFAHVRGDPHDAAPSTTEHGCGATAHRCQCCPTLPALARARYAIAKPGMMPPDPAADRSDVRSDGVIATLFRPPIA